MHWKLLAVGGLASLASAAPQVGVPIGSACGPVNHETRKVGDGNPNQDVLNVQISHNLGCSGGECKMSREEAESREVKAKFSVSGHDWWSADLEVIEKKSTGTIDTCKSSGHDRVCMWARVYHTGYTVQDFKSKHTAWSCSGWQEDGGEYIIQSPNANDLGGPECRYDDDCVHKNAEYWDMTVATGGPP